MKSASRPSSFVRLRRSYGIGFCALFLLLLAGTHTVWTPFHRRLPSPPPLPDWRAEYVSGYRGRVEHDLYLQNLFGFAQPLRESNVILVGTSHVMFGLSARQLSEVLTAYCGRPVRVFNLGLPYAEGPVFTARTLERQSVRDAVVVLDLFTAFDGSQEKGEYSSCGFAALESSWVKARAFVFNIWFQFYWDRATDGLGPSFLFPGEHPLQDPPVSVSRRLSDIDVRSRFDGDILYIWNPKDGVIYGGPSGTNRVFSVKEPNSLVLVLRDRGVALPPPMPSFFLQHRLKPFLTLIPYLGFLPEKAAQIAAGVGYPYVPIGGDGLSYIDDHHLTVEGRRAATERLAVALEKEADLRLLLAPPPRSAGNSVLP